MPEIQYFSEPVKFCIVYDYNTPEVVNTLKNHLNKTLKPRLVEHTGAAQDSFGTRRKKNMGKFIYENTDPTAIHGNTIKEYIKRNIKEDNPFCSRLMNMDIFGRLVSYYKKDDYYRPHKDDAIVTCIYYLWDEPKTFEGGDLYFGDFKVPIRNNSMLFFYSDTEHAVSTLTNGEGRWAVTYFMGCLGDRTKIEGFNEFVNVLSREEFINVRRFIEGPGWQFGQYSFNKPKDPDMSTEIVNRYPFWIMDLSNEPFFNTVLLKRIEEITFRKFKLIKVYANGQTYGQDGSWHYDSRAPNTWTFLLYMSDLDTMSENAGETMFISKTESLTVVANMKNKGVLFPSSVVHRGMGPARNYSSLRVTVAWKLEEVFD